MIIFAIESSCDDTSAAVIKSDENGKLHILSNVVSSQTDIHALYGGVVPEIASRAHCEAITNVAHKAVEDAGITLNDINAVAVTFGPGLVGSLLVGVNYAKSLAYTLNVPLIPVNHIEGHVAAAYLEHDVKPPYLALVVSGGHTSLYEVSDYTTFTEIGSTMDDAAGESFDKVGRVIGLPYPGGAAMDKLAKKGFPLYTALDKSVRNTVYRFPSPALNDDTLNFSFSGLKTAMINYIHNLVQKQGLEDGSLLDDDTKALTAAAFTKTVCDGISKKLDMALKSGKYTSLVMAGGVAANSHLRKAVENVCVRNKVDFISPSIKLCGDNAAMTAAQGYHLYNAGIIADNSLNAYASDEGVAEFYAKLGR